jgi:cell division protein FtsW (lipid II flippase)
VARDARDLYGNCLALGVTFLIGLPAIVNMGVMGVTAGSSLLLTGTFLPLVSCGGSSVMVTLFYVGILHGISSRKDDEVMIDDAPDLHCAHPSLWVSMIQVGHRLGGARLV